MGHTHNTIDDRHAELTSRMTPEMCRFVGAVVLLGWLATVAGAQTW